MDKPVKLFYCMMGFHRLKELQQLQTIHKLLPYVDQFIYVDGSEGTDGTFDWLNKEFPGEPIMFINSKWSDDFPGQRTLYLDLVCDLSTDDYDNWVIVNDTDEVFSEILSKNIRTIVNKSRKNTDMVLVRCKSITINEKGKRIYENMDDFYKPLIFKHYPGMMYWGDRSEVTGNKTALHESLQVNGHFKWRPIKLNDNGILYYEHIKLENIIWERGCRNFIVFGGGPNLGTKQPLWKPFRDLLAECLSTTNYTSWDVLNYFRRGNIDSRIKDWMIKYRNEDGYDGASEIRECFLTYFILYNANELPDQLKNDYKHLLV